MTTHFQHLIALTIKTEALETIDLKLPQRQKTIGRNFLNSRTKKIKKILRDHPSKKFFESREFYESVGALQTNIFIRSALPNQNIELFNIHVRKSMCAPVKAISRANCPSK